MYKKYMFITIIAAFAICYCIATCAFAGKDATIQVTNRNLGRVDRLILGSSIIGHLEDHERKLKENVAVGASYGYGVWDPKWNSAVEDTENLSKDAGIRVYRFIGLYHGWQDGVSIPGKERKYFFGIDEQMKFCEDTNTKAIICFPYIFEGPQELVGLVRYLNEEADPELLNEIKSKKFDNNILYGKYVRNIDGSLSWGNLRAINGHSEPYMVEYFEIGNEIYMIMKPEQYGGIYLDFYKAIKEVCSYSKVGVVLNDESWNKKIMDIIKGSVDFGVVHIYPTPVWGEALSQFSVKDIFEISFAQAYIDYDRYIESVLAVLNIHSHKNIPLAVTEFNCGFVQNEPVPYRHTLGCALVNAELIRTFMKPENNILIANYWNFNNSYTGMITNGFDGVEKTLNRPYFERPNYYVFEMYSKHFGGNLIENNVKCDSYDVQGKKIPYLSVNTSKSNDGNKIYIIAVNIDINHEVRATINLEDFIPASDGNSWVLNGPSIDATNEVKHDNVKIIHKKFKINGSPFEFTFEPHSLTAIEIEKE